MQSNFGIDGNINFSQFRFSFIQINPGDCDYPIIATYPAIQLHSSQYKECFDFHKEGPYRKDRKHTLFKFKGMASDIDFLASDLLNEQKAGGEHFGLIKHFKVGQTDDLILISIRAKVNTLDKLIKPLLDANEIGEHASFWIYSTEAL